jgi:hypothetical protein
MQMDTDVFIKNNELEQAQLEVYSYSSFITFRLKEGYRNYVSMHLDTREYDLESQEMVDDHRGLEWLRGQLQSCIHQLDDLLDPDRGEPSDDPEFPAGEEFPW